MLKHSLIVLLETFLYLDFSLQGYFKWIITFKWYHWDSSKLDNRDPKSVIPFKVLKCPVQQWHRLSIGNIKIAIQRICLSMPVQHFSVVLVHDTLIIQSIVINVIKPFELLFLFWLNKLECFKHANISLYNNGID